MTKRPDLSCQPAAERQFSTFRASVAIDERLHVSEEDLHGRRLRVSKLADLMHRLEDLRAKTTRTVDGPL